ncbi:MAG: serine/threonine protein kinase, partial [Clostridiales bacterium]|nr:serine/threonine protein kinase [Clostridiales bacterium]
MYVDTILFIIGGACAILALTLAIYLIASRKKSRSYRTVLKQETELLTSLSPTSQLSQLIENNDPAIEDRGKQREEQTVSQNPTGLPLEEAGTELLPEGPDNAPDFDIPALAGQYIIKSELHRSKISRVFLAQSAKLGNLWVIKFVPKQSGQLANEENILKLLHHISLPKIIDIFQDDNGTYLVESFIEGCSLDKLLKAGEKINQNIIIDWAEQIAQVLNYLHNMESCPVYHLDLKPANIMVTHDNRLVLIDFGISKRFGQDDMVSTGLTYKYAAPEQIKYNVPNKHLPLIARRFGELPLNWLYWLPDARTDIYSLGVILFEFAMGEIPTLQNITALENAVSSDLSAIISKCLALDPLARYQSVCELLLDLQKIKGSKIKMAKSLLMRKAAALTAACAIVFSGGSFAGGYHVYGQENMALLGIGPEAVIISRQQSSELSVDKHFPDGRTVSLDNTRVSWSFSEDNIARVDGNRILGINPGETELNGLYRNKAIKLNVRVVEPMDGMVDISQRYQTGYLVQLFAGT